MEKQRNRWLILIAAILINISLGSGYMWGVFSPALASQLGWEGISWAYSLSLGLVPVAMIIFGPYIDKNGGKKVALLAGILFGIGMFTTGLIKSKGLIYLTYGLINGIGIGAGYGAATATAGKWFPDKKGLAGGLTAAGFGSGALLLTPILSPLSQPESLGIQGTFKVMGIAFFIIIVVASLFLDKAPQASAPTTGAPVADNSKNWKQMLKEGRFWHLWLIYVLAATAGMMFIGHIGDIVPNKGLHAVATAPILVMVGAAANTVGRIFWGAVSDKIGKYLAVVCMFICSAAGLVLLLLSGSIGAFAGVIGMVLVYLAFGGFLGAYPGITGENWGTRFVGANYGWMFTAYGVAAILGPQIASIIGNYDTTFIISAVMAVVGIFLMLPFVKKNRA